MAFRIAAPDGESVDDAREYIENIVERKLANIRGRVVALEAKGPSINIDTGDVPTSFGNGGSSHSLPPPKDLPELDQGSDEFRTGYIAAATTHLFLLANNYPDQRKFLREIYEDLGEVMWNWKELYAKES